MLDAFCALGGSFIDTARAYGDLERGKFCFSAPTLMALLLILKEDEVAELLNDFRKITEKLDGKEVA